jgi:hypothetical protein
MIDPEAFLFASVATFLFLAFMAVVLLSLIADELRSRKKS